MSERWRYITAAIAIQPTLRTPLNYKNLYLHLSSSKPQAGMWMGSILAALSIREFPVLSL